MATLTHRPGGARSSLNVGAAAESLHSMRRLRQLDVYRKVPRDLTEGSAVGGVVSVVAVVVLVVIAAFELHALAQVRRETEIVVDRGDNEWFRINLNISLPGMSCEFASVNLRNSLGVRRDDISDNTLHKFQMDRGNTYGGSATKVEAPVVEHTYGGTNKDHYGNQRHALELSPATFETALQDYEVLLVNFHSPRCIHCIRFAPVYEHAADLVKQRAPKVQDARSRKAVALATVDCVQHLDLCRGEHIQAYPTVLVFRTRQDLDVKKEEQQYEAYLGAREAEAVASFALKVLEEVMVADPALGKDAFDVAAKKAAAAAAAAEKSKQQESVVFKSKGCRIEGFLDVRRVPGSIVIRPHSRDAGHEFDTGLISVDHRINHLSFGHKGTGFVESDDGPFSRSVAKPQVRVVTAKAEDADDAAWFRSPEADATHVHSVKVVSKSLVPLRGEPTNAFQYSVSSDTFKPQDKVPFIEIDYDLSPLMIVVTETRRGWIEGVVGVLAVVGGVFSASFIVEGVVSYLVARFVGDVALGGGPKLA